MFCQRPKTEDFGRSLIKQKNSKNASLPKIIHNGNFSSQIYVFFYSSAFKSKTEKIENFSENSKKSLNNTIFNRFVFKVLWCEDCKPILQQSKKMLQIRHWIFVLVFFFPNHISRNRIIVSLNSFGFSMWSKWSASLTHAKHAFGNTWNRNYFENILKNLGCW